MKWYHWALLAVLIGGGGAMLWTETRGLRNKNPGNIRAGSPWRGSIGQDDAGYVIFDSYVNGIRAMLRVLKNYERSHGLRTIRQIIYRWAPPVENNTESYISGVVQSTGIGQVELLSLTQIDDKPVLLSLAKAITKHENGFNPIPDDAYDQAWEAERA